MILLAFIASLFISGNSIDKEVENYLSKRFSNFEKFEYQILSLPKTSSKIELKSNGEFRLNNDVAYIPVNYASNNGTAAAFISVKVKLFKKVLVASSKVNSKTELNNFMFTERLVDVSMIRENLVDVNEAISSYRSKTLLNSGDILTEDKIELIPILKSGDEVTAIKQIGSVTVTTQAVLREDGRYGERVKIKTADNKQFIARVINQKQVSIEE